MKSSHETVIRCPLEKAFLTVADLVRWPEFLPHYRYNRFLEKGPAGGVVRMSCYRLGYPLRWVARYKIDLAKRRLTFKHVKGALNATQGMDIVWQFTEESENAVRVKVTYDFSPSLKVGGELLARLVLGDLFVHSMAEKTLTALKRRMETRLTLAEAVAMPVTKEAPELVRGRRIRRRISSRPRGPV
jgi:ribosome-associated toxin RatA of RatAB toxin-antitoxin module